MLALLLSALVAPDLAGGDEGVPVTRSAERGVDARVRTLDGPWAQSREAEHALAIGLAWLAARQAATLDGSFPESADHKDEFYAPIGVAALGALAFLAAGNAPDRGPYGREVGRAIDYLLAHADLDPASDRHGYIGRESDHSRIHGHGFATLALAQAWSMSPTSARGARIQEALVAAVRLIERAQGVQGGWWYEPKRSRDHEGSTTICLVQALRAARNSGIRVDPDVIHRAEAYVAASQEEDGRFRYRLDLAQHSLALTAAAISTLNAAGTYDGAPIERGTAAMWRELVLRDELRAGRADGELPPEHRPRFPFYERLYLAQALWHHPDPALFERWAPAESARVVAAQRADGRWESLDYGDCYATATNCLFLALPEGLLPIFQR